jgi:hypothetical protein
MASVADLQHTFVGHLRPAIIVQPRSFGECTKHVQLCQCGSRLLDFGQLSQHFLPDALEQFVFQFHAALLRAKDFPFHFLQLRRDETLTVGDGLLAMIMRRHFV